MIRIIAFILVGALSTLFVAAFIGETALLFLEFGGDLGLTMATFAPQQFIFFPTLGLVALLYFRPAGQTAFETALSRPMPAIGGLIVVAVAIAGTFVMVGMFRGPDSDRSWWEVAPEALLQEHYEDVRRARVQAVEDASAAVARDPSAVNVAGLEAARATNRLVADLEVQLARASAVGDTALSDELQTALLDASMDVPRVRSVIAAFSRMGPAVREGLDLSEHVGQERASTSLNDFRGLARLLPDTNAYCIATGAIEPVAACRKAQSDLRDTLNALYAESPSELAGRHNVFLAIKTAFLFYVFGLGIFMLANHEAVEDVTGERVKLASRALPVGALAVLFWPILNQAYVQSMRAMFGLDQSGSFVELAPLYVAFAIVWTATIVLFFLRLTKAGTAAWSQVGTLTITAVTVLQFDMLVRQMNVFIGAGAEPASLISAVVLLSFIAWQARLILGAPTAATLAGNATRLPNTEGKPEGS